MPRGQRRRSPNEGQHPVARGGLGSALKKLTAVVKDQDQFGETVSLRVDEDTDQVKSLAGTCCSLLILIVIVAYAWMKMDVLLEKKDINIVSTINDLHYGDDFVFSYDNGFNIAVAFTAYDSEREQILDPSYGELVFNSYEWGPNPDGSYFTRRERLETHICTREELGIDGNREGARFMPIHEQGANLIELYQKKLLCLDKRDLFIYGDYNSVQARQLNIQLVECQGGPANGCQTDEDIAKFFKDKFLFMVYNQIRFDQDNYGQDAIEPETRIFWQRVNTQVRETIPFKILTTLLQLQDLMINMDELTELSDTRLFKLQQLSNQPYEKDEQTRTDITIEMNLDKQVISRDGYTFLDWVSDVGGMQGMLISAMAVLLGIWNHNYFDNYLVEQLYMLGKPKDDRGEIQGGKDTPTDQNGQLMRPTMLQNLKEYMREWLPSCLLRRKCCAQSRLMRGFGLSREKLARETSVIEIIRQLRFNRVALKAIMKGDMRAKLIDYSQFKVVCPEREIDGSDGSNDGSSGSDGSQTDEFNSCADLVAEGVQKEVDVSQDKKSLDRKSHESQPPLSSTRYRLNQAKASLQKQDEQEACESKRGSSEQDGGQRNRNCNEILALAQQELDAAERVPKSLDKSLNDQRAASSMEMPIINHRSKFFGAPPPRSLEPDFL